MTNAIATQQATTVSVIPSADEWGTIYNMAKALLPTGFLPNSIKTAEQATAIMLKGRELNVPPMYALSNIVVVQGKPTVSAEMMLALVQRDHGMNAMWVDESTNEFCKVGYKSGSGTKSYTFSINDAKLAGITKNPVWTQYPAAMCRARAISAVARMAFPGSIAGMYVPGELGESVVIDDEGQVISSPGEYSQQPTPIKNQAGETVGSVQRIDDDGVIEADERDPWTVANNYFHVQMKQHDIAKDEQHAMIRKWNVPSGSTAQMDVEKLRKACDFIDKHSDIKAYAVKALADEKELAEINQLTIEEAQD